MFEKKSDMMTTRSVGSPAFLPPELCVAKHGEVSGKAADIWSMGISLYCLRFGRLPFERPAVLELYEAIKYDDINYPPETEPQLLDLMERILQKDPKKRITLKDLRVWNSGCYGFLYADFNRNTLGLQKAAPTHFFPRKKIQEVF